MCNSLQPDCLGKVLTRSEEKGTAGRKETNSKWPIVSLKNVLTPINRSESVNPERTYHILGAHWYAEGLYTKEIIKGSLIRASKVYRIERGDFVYNRLFAWKGSFAVATDENHGCYVSNEFPTFEINSDLLDSKYLQRLFSRASMWEEALGLSTGGTPTSRNRLKEEKLLAMEIPIPPLDEQRRIVARIEELAARIEEARELRRRAVEEADVLMNKCSEYLFDNKDCNTRSIESICEVKGGIQKSSERAPGANPRRYITVAHVQRNRIDISDPRYFEVSEEELEKWRLLPGDVLVIEGNGSADQIGRTALFCGEIDDCVHQNHVIRIRPNQTRVLPDYLNGFLNSPLGQKEMRERSRTTSGLFNLSVGRIKSIDVPLPAFNDQRLIVERIHDLQSKFDLLKRHQAETATELDALLPTVLERAFRGEL